MLTRLGHVLHVVALVPAAGLIIIGMVIWSEGPGNGAGEQIFLLTCVGAAFFWAIGRGLLYLLSGQ